MIKIECPFICLFGDKINCPYTENFTYCHDVGISPGNGDAWCSKKIEEALNMEKKEEPSTLTRQNYSCNICGLKSFVTYSSKEDVFDIAIKIRNDHEKREPTCPCPVDDLNMVGDPIKV
jgi:hypothetical protein